MKIYFVRHGETVWNTLRIFQGSSNSPLTETGREQAKRLGEKLKEAREKANLSQQEVADKLNVSRQTISKYELNINEPDLETLKELSCIYGVDIKKAGALSQVYLDVERIG